MQMEDWIVAFWVVLGVAIPVIALTLARRARMKRIATGSEGPHRPHGRHRAGP